MDSLELPFDLIWEGKPEPLSPADLALANAEDVLIYDNDNDGFGLTNPDYLKSERCGDEVTKSQMCALEMLLELQQQALAIDSVGYDDDNSNISFEYVADDIVDMEMADQWLNQSMNFYPLDGYADAAAAVNNMGGMRPPPAATNQQPVKVEQTAQLIREFDSVFEVVELTHLTPPQTPPQSPPRQPEPKQTGFIFPSQPQQHPHINALSTNNQHHLINNTNIINIIPNNGGINANYFLFDGALQNHHSAVAASPMTTQDIAHEMEVVEELVRARAENLPDWTDEDDEDDEDNDDDYDDSNDTESTTNSVLLLPPSPSSSSSSSCHSSAGSSPRSDSSYHQDDVDWSPLDKSPVAAASKTNSTAAKQQRRTRPYGRSADDKKSRKKEQNKNAATRYRQKKKAEIEVALDEERDLLDVHTALQGRCADVQREIKYLKSLMRDLYRAKAVQ